MPDQVKISRIVLRCQIISHIFADGKISSMKCDPISSRVSLLTNRIIAFELIRGRSIQSQRSNKRTCCT